VAERFVAGRARGRAWGPARLKAELERRGATRELAAAAVRSSEVDVGATLATALDRLERRAPAGWWRLPARRARMVSSLAGRGFAVPDAIRAVAERAAERENDSDASDDEPRDPIELP
jgi:SOS response regulatory protein OraA/RecX